jgi:hypothetical protein
MISVGDLVVDICDDYQETGLVLKVDREVEVPPIITILWQYHGISKTTSDDISVISEILNENN